MNKEEIERTERIGSMDIKYSIEMENLEELEEKIKHMLKIVGDLENAIDEITQFKLIVHVDEAEE